MKLSRAQKNLIESGENRLSSPMQFVSRESRNFIRLLLQNHQRAVERLAHILLVTSRFLRSEFSSANMLLFRMLVFSLLEKIVRLSVASNHHRRKRARRLKTDSLELGRKTFDDTELEYYSVKYVHM